jgi:hypothetical protein
MVNMYGICNRTGGYFTKLVLSCLQPVSSLEIVKKLSFAVICLYAKQKHFSACGL